MTDETHARFDPPELRSDPVIDAYKAGIDRTLLRENLKLSPDERIRKLAAFVRFTAELRAAGRTLLHVIEYREEKCPAILKM